MSKHIKKCKVCGCEYVVCSTALNTHDRFAYEKVACSPECGAEYFRRVMEARGELPSASETVSDAPIESEASEPKDMNAFVSAQADESIGEAALLSDDDVVVVNELVEDEADEVSETPTKKRKK